MIIKIDNAKTFKMPPGSFEFGLKGFLKRNHSRTTKLSMTYGSDFSECGQLLLLKTY